MPEDADWPEEPDWNVIVIGAGPAGLSAARALVAGGLSRVLVLERNPQAGGLPRFYDHRGWGVTVAFLSFATTLYSSAFAALAAGCAVFLYISYALPVAAGIFAENRSWTSFGPFKLGFLSKPFAVTTTLGTIVLLWIGTRPPNDILDNYAIALLVLLVLGWFAIERRRFAGPPIGQAIATRSAEIAAEEQAVGGVQAIAGE